MSFSFFKFSLKRKRKSKTPQTSLLLLEVNKNNSKIIPESSSIKMIGVDGFVISSLNFKHVIMANCNALEITIGC
jgi:hypothetical protein